MLRSWRPLLPVSLLLGAAACGPSPEPAALPEGPSLVVLLVIDQLSAELLDRYAPVYEGGLRRILDAGFRFENATHDHASTVTAVGHTTLSTGVYPARHEIIGNEWFEREGDEWRSVYSMSDPDARILGHPELEGMGPANIERPGIADWIAARDPRSRIVSIAKKERSAIGLSAQATGDVYWLPETEAEFVTSDVYMSSYPDWVRDFNRTEMPVLHGATIWESIVPPALASLSRSDTSRWEFDREDTTFPHRASDHVDLSDAHALNEWRWDYTPFPDRAVVSLVLEALRALELGQRGSVDYLGIGLSQTDRIGHTFGPGSREQLDNLIRLDAELGRLFAALDDQVGPGRWVLALSADHGVLEIPEHLADTGVLAGRLTRAERGELAARIDAGSAGGVWAIREAVAELPFVAGAYTFDEIERGPPADSFAVLYSHSHSRTRVTSLAARSGVYVRYQPNFLQTNTAATTHGSPYYYDRHVPLIFLGAGIRAGVSDERVATIDVAPTLAALAGVAAPEDLDGRPIAALLGR